ncbi:PREDICTED: uncharacterized protein LOC107093265 [Cyprinodon variegatus]|uniref:uncharacterized protein LOC107093265 n=1 Tax=Cyprinodon variegatus TaxID=28743 RepID=UPI0007429BE1|nr:PREDICTED: uncharacterized protein LOC107093265 [Cyprinodon variegatus]
MRAQMNRRGYLEHFVEKRQLNIKDLKFEAERFGLENRYLQMENIPEYPKPEFHVSLLKHDTTGSGLRGIRKDGGFRDPYGGSLVWWSLTVGPEELKDAEMRLLEKTFPDRMEVEDPEQQSFLWRFATSPAFKETSRLGCYRFTFSLEEVLTAYREQFCSGSEPIMRVYRTVLYKQEVMHVVLVHSPTNQNFSRYPLLTNDPDGICAYRDGHFIWRPEAMCETHWWELFCRHDSQQLEVCAAAENLHYVWNHAAIALHVGKTQLQTSSWFLLGGLQWGRAPVGTPYWEEPPSAPAEQPLFLPQRGTIFNREVTIIDTPGLSGRSNPDLKKEIFRCINLWSPAPHAVLLVVRLGFFTTNVEETVKQMEEMFGENVWSRTMILFTHQDQAEPDVKTQLQKNGDQMKILLQKVGNRFQVLNNNPRHRDVQQVWDLLSEVKEMLVTQDLFNKNVLLC